MNIIEEVEKIVAENNELKEKLKALEIVNRNLSMRERLYQSELSKLKNNIKKLLDEINTTPHSKDNEYQNIVYGEDKKVFEEFYPQLWKDTLYEMLQDSIVFQCTNNDWSGDIKNHNDTVMSNGDIINISQRKFFALTIPDIKTAQNDINMMKSYLLKSKNSIQEAMEEYMLSLHDAIPFINIIGNDDYSIRLNKDNVYEYFFKLHQLIKDTNIKETPYVIINPYIESFVINSAEFISANKISDSSLRKYAIGRIAGMDVLVSTNIENKNNKCFALAGYNNYITFASKLTCLEDLKNKDINLDYIRGLYLYGLKFNEYKFAKMVVSIG